MRGDEIRRLNSLSGEELVERAGERLLILDSIEELHAHFARSVADRVRANARARMILPYGPVGQYPLLAEIVNSERISLGEATLYFMDEYADRGGRPLPAEHPLSFRGGLERLLEAIDEPLRPDPERVIFPGPGNAEAIAQDIAEHGLEACYGGIGVHGHVAFNEPEAGVSGASVRLVRLNDFTVTINAIRSEVGGDLENFPRQAWTLGMKECLAADRIELYCRNDICDWANTVLRLAVLGAPGDDYPVTWIREHANYRVVTDRATAARARYVV